MLTSLKVGLLVPFEAMRMVWRHKGLMWYGLWHAVAHFATCWAIMRCGLQVYGAMQICYLFALPGISCVARDFWCIATAVVVVLVLAYVVAFIFALLTKKVLAYNRGTPISAQECLLPAPHLYGCLFVITLVYVAAATLATVSLGVLPLWAALLLYAILYMALILIMPIFVDRNVLSWVAIAQSFKLALKHPVTIFSAVVATFVGFALCAGLTFGLSVVITQAICGLLTVQVCMALMLPFLLQVVPWFFVSWYLVTVAMVVPALIYEAVK